MMTAVLTVIRLRMLLILFWLCNFLCAAAKGDGTHAYSRHMQSATHDGIIYVLMTDGRGGVRLQSP